MRAANDLRNLTPALRGRRQIAFSAGILPVLILATTALAEDVTVTYPPSTGNEVTVTTAPSSPNLPEVVVPSQESDAPGDKPQKKPTKPAATDKKKATKSAAVDPSEKGGDGSVKGSSQSIVVLVNDEPITGYEISQRQRMLGVGADIGDKAQANFKALLKSPRTNERWKELVERTVKANQSKTREQIIAIIDAKRKEFGQQLQREAVESARKTVLPGLRDKALDELIDERLKLQEAKRLNLVASDEEVNNSVNLIAQKNKMTEKEFAEYLKKIGTDIDMMKQRFRANMSWQQVIRRQFGHRISVTERDIDRFVEKLPGSGSETVELNLQRIVLPLLGKIEQKLIAQRIADAEALVRKGGGCDSMATNAASVAGARFENLGPRPAGSVPEPTRSLLLNANDGELLPPVVASGSVEVWAVCSRKTVAADLEKRESAQAELRQKEFEILAQKHLKDLRQDAAIEYR